MSGNKTILKDICVILLAILITNTLSAKNSIMLENWLKAGPLEIKEPVFSDETDLRGNVWDLADMLEFDYLDIQNIEPDPNSKINWFNNQPVNWKITTANPDGIIQLSSNSSNRSEVTYLINYLQSERWIKGDLSIKSKLPVKVWVDDQEVIKKDSLDTRSSAKAEAKTSVKLEKGIHKVVIKLCKPGNYREDVQFTASLEMDDKYQVSINTFVEPFEYMDIEHLLYVPKVEKVAISAEGNLFAVQKKHIKNSGNTESWIEIRNYADGSLMQTYRGGMNLKNFKWAPQGDKFAYTTKEDEKSSIWQYNIESGKTTRIVEDIEKLDSYQWTKDGENLIYSVKFKHPEEKTGVRRVKSLEDRQPANRYDHYLYRVNIKKGYKQRLTAGKLSTKLDALSPDGEKLIFSRHHIDYDKRPFSYNTHYVLNLKDLTIDSLFTTRWMNTIQWSPEGDKLLITGGPSMFNRAGVNLPKGEVPNEYDTQAYIYDLSSSKVKPISLSFAPSINKGQWIENDKIIFLALDRSQVNLFEYNVSKNTYVGIESNIESIEDLDFAQQNNNNGIYYGTSANSPIKINKLKFGWRGANELLLDPMQKYYKNVELSRIKRWTFNNKDGIEIEGRVYYPPEFDRTKKYPCIVYYYGGTSPVSRSFDGRYPKNYWAANGYIVYVMQPSGATGFGQEFSAKHVNEWGSIVPEEIIRGVQKFIDGHPFVDKNKLGCIGASYGGFTTEELITRTDMFSAAVSHAGISSIPGYWGEGYWGYEYGAVANATKYPWRDTDFFIDNSAYFDAEKIETPLLLTHGTDDHNVPPGQSIQLYTALKILGKEVELIECTDQRHWIMEPKQREKWTKSIVAWFDKWLKAQPEWWNDLY
ncbi:MAG: prolyl oligopeptidase family serine peptidase [Candidatus Marinimicrobia bacterium]|nr:prolyl oligopeptidase family serine peptidase [Candidatus Neomarinimicrobiota bacterium]